MRITTKIQFSLQVIDHPDGLLEAVIQIDDPGIPQSHDKRWGTVLFRDGHAAFHPLHEWRFFTEDMKGDIINVLTMWKLERRSHA